MLVFLIGITNIISRLWTVQIREYHASSRKAAVEIARKIAADERRREQEEQRQREELSP